MVRFKNWDIETDIEHIVNKQKIITETYAKKMCLKHNLIPLF